MFISYCEKCLFFVFEYFSCKRAAAGFAALRRLVLHPQAIRRRQSGKLRSFDPPPRCLTHTSRWNYLIKSSIFYTIQETRSRVAASFRNHGSRALESTFSLTSTSAIPTTCSHGKPSSRTLLPLPHVTLKRCPSAATTSLRLWEQERVVGYRLFLASCNLR